jgi:hypothetical protein
VGDQLGYRTTPQRDSARRSRQAADDGVLRSFPPGAQPHDLGTGSRRPPGAGDSPARKGERGTSPTAPSTSLPSCGSSTPAQRLVRHVCNHAPHDLPSGVRRRPRPSRPSPIRRATHFSEADGRSRAEARHDGDRRGLAGDPLTAGHDRAEDDVDFHGRKGRSSGGSSSPVEIRTRCSACGMTLPS